MIQTTDRLLILAKTFSEKLFETLSDRIECDRKNRFLPFYHFRNNLSFTYINSFSKKSSQDEFGSNWGWWKEFVSYILNFAPTSLLMIRTTNRLLILAKTFSEKSFEMLSDQIEWDGKNCFLPLYHLRNNLSLQTFNFGKNLLWEVVWDAFGPNWVWRKELSPTFISFKK